MKLDFIPTSYSQCQEGVNTDLSITGKQSKCDCHLTGYLGPCAHCGFIPARYNM